MDDYGYIYAMGSNEAGQLGQGGEFLNGSRKPLMVFIDGSVKKIVAGGMHSLVLCENGKVWSWGCNDDGALGRETDQEGVPGIVDYLPPIKAISAGDGHSAAISVEGSVFICGVFRDDNGVIGLISDRTSKSGSRVFIKVEIEDDPTFTDIASGNNHILMLSADGEVWALGNSAQKQLGNVFLARDWTKPRKILNFKCDRIWCGHFCSFVRALSSSEILAMGLNNCTQLGFECADKDDLIVAKPTLDVNFHEFITRRTGTIVDDVSASDHHTLFLTKDGFVYSSGRSDYGRLGTGMSEGCSIFPTIVPSLCPYKIVRVSAGLATSYAVSECGRLFCCGMSDNKTTGFKEDIFEPVELTFGYHLENESVERPYCMDVKAGGQHVIILVC